jgi:hypothetical protein
MALICTPFAVFFGYKWLALDEPDIRYSCKGDSTCWSGETVNMMLTSMFGAFPLIFAGITVVVVTRWSRWRKAAAQRPDQIAVDM